MGKMVANFSEGVLVGYRWNDAKGIPSAFPFGFGLTYTEFEFTDFKLTYGAGRAKVTLKVANVGGRDGAAVPQVYVGFTSLKPVVRQLRDFQKVQVPKGSEISVAFFLGEEDWSYWDEAAGKWASAADNGEAITVSVGTSSADLLWHHTLTEHLDFK